VELLIQVHVLVVDDVLDAAARAELPEHEPVDEWQLKCLKDGCQRSVQHFLLFVEGNAQERVDVVVDGILDCRQQHQILGWANK
jgi:hypothetical protein